LLLSRKALMLCDARFRAGTLFTPTPEERAFFSRGDTPLQLDGPLSYLTCAFDALWRWPQTTPPLTPEADETRLRAVHGALRAALEMDARGFLNCSAATMRMLEGVPMYAVSAVSCLLQPLLTGMVDASGAKPWHRLRAVCDISDADEAALRQLLQRSVAHVDDINAAFSRIGDERAVATRQRATEDLARFGLRACALPECGAMEPQPKTFKVCSRCRGVVYCSVAHQQADWRRHKRADGCKAAA
jgi:hypothetical protein